MREARGGGGVVGGDDVIAKRGRRQKAKTSPGHQGDFGPEVQNPFFRGEVSLHTIVSSLTLRVSAIILIGDGNYTRRVLRSRLPPRGCGLCSDCWNSVSVLHRTPWTDPRLEMNLDASLHPYSPTSTQVTLVASYMTEPCSMCLSLSDMYYYIVSHVHAGPWKVVCHRCYNRVYQFRRLPTSKLRPQKWIDSQGMMFDYVKCCWIDITRDDLKPL